MPQELINFASLRRAAEMNNAGAQFRLAQFYDHGQGVPKSDGEAMMWYHKAASAGNDDAVAALAGFYFDGRPLLRAMLWPRHCGPLPSSVVWPKLR
jgi:TPR repeat protein